MVYASACVPTVALHRLCFARATPPLSCLHPGSTHKEHACGLAFFAYCHITHWQCPMKLNEGYRLADRHRSTLTISLVKFGPSLLRITTRSASSDIESLRPGLGIERGKRVYSYTSRSVLNKELNPVVLWKRAVSDHRVNSTRIPRGKQGMQNEWDLNFRFGLEHSQY